MKIYSKFFVGLVLIILLGGCAAGGGLNIEKALGVGSGVLQATTLSEDSVKQTATLAAAELDGQTKVADENDPYSVRLRKLTKGLENYDGLNLNFKVYLAPADSADSLTALFSTWVIPLGTQMMIRGLTSVLRLCAFLIK